MNADDTVIYFKNLCTSEIARAVEKDLNELYNRWKVAGFS